MKHLIFIFLAGSFIASCNSNTNSTEQKQEEAVTTAREETTTYYAGNSGKDTVLLKLQRNDNKVTGQLDYRFYEKDKTTGTIDGQMHGDTLIAEYRFMSEGTTSVRQVAFFKNETALIEGYGDMEDKNGMMVFKNTGSLRFGDGFTLQQTACK